MLRIKKGWIIILMISFIIVPVSAIPNPSAVYCDSLGYNYTISKTDGGGEVGICQFPDGSTDRAWAFLRGEAGQEHNYCKEKGYEFKVVENNSKCPGMYFGKCVLCVSPGGKETEVTELMKQDGKFPDFSKWTLSRCNHNQVCEPEKGENNENCPQDCSGKAGDPEKSYLIYYFILALLVALLLLFIACRKIQEKKKWNELERKHTKK